MTDPAAASLFTMALGLQPPWEVVEVAFDPDAGRIDFQVAFAPGSALCLPALRGRGSAGA